MRSRKVREQDRVNRNYKKQDWPKNLYTKQSYIIIPNEENKNSMQLPRQEVSVGAKKYKPAQATLPIMQKKRMKFFLLPLVSAMAVSTGEISATIIKANPSA